MAEGAVVVAVVAVALAAQETQPLVSAYLGPSTWFGTAVWVAIKLV